MKASFETRVLALALAAGLPGTFVALTLLVVEDYSAKVLWTFGLLVVGFWLSFAFALRERVVRPLQTLSNLLAALLEGDYSIRSRGATTDDALGLAMLEVNALGETLREQRLGALEASALEPFVRRRKPRRIGCCTRFTALASCSFSSTHGTGRPAHGWPSGCCRSSPNAGRKRLAAPGHPLNARRQQAEG